MTHLSIITIAILFLFITERLVVSSQYLNSDNNNNNINDNDEEDNEYNDHALRNFINHNRGDIFDTLYYDDDNEEEEQEDNIWLEENHIYTITQYNNNMYMGPSPVVTIRMPAKPLLRNDLASFNTNAIGLFREL